MPADRQMSPADRVQICLVATQWLAAGQTLPAVSRTVGVAQSTLARWLRTYRAGGPDALAGRSRNAGRPAISDSITPALAAKIRRIAAKTHSAVLAYDAISLDPSCPIPLRDYLRGIFDGSRGGKRIDLPLSLRRIARVTPELDAKRKSDTAFWHVAYKSRHTDMVMDPITGAERRLLAGDIYLSDDMSSNHPYWFELPEGEVVTRAHRGDKLAARHGVAIGRQGLYTIDARGKWLGCDLTGRPTDAYTAADVLRHFRHVVEAYGLPRIGWILEQGVWCARTVDGLTAIVGDDSRAEVVAGLSSLGIRVQHVHTSEGKALIEGAFGHLQNVCDMLDVPTVGRKRGEMERVERLMRQAQTGVKHPRDIGLPHIADALAYMQKAMVFCNTRAKFGRIQNGVPDEVWAADTLTYPLRPLTDEHCGVFFPAKKETAIRQGCVECRMDSELYRFTAPELFGGLGAGYRVAFAFDPGEPTAGAALWNLETGAKNVRAYGPGQFMGRAEFDVPAPLWGNTAATADAYARKRKYTRAFVLAHGSTGLFGRGTHRGLERRGAAGELARVEINFGDGGGEDASVGFVSPTAAKGVSVPGGSSAIPAFSAARRKQMTAEDAAAEAARAEALERRLAAVGDLILPG